MGSGDPPLPRVFFDSGVIIEGLLASWSASHALLIFARTGAFKAIVAEDVREEVEEALHALLVRSPAGGSDAIRTYARLVRALDPERVPITVADEVARSRHLI